MDLEINAVVSQKSFYVLFLCVWVGGESFPKISAKLPDEPDDSQQSAFDGKGDGQLLEPHTKLPLHSLSLSQSPSFKPQGLDEEQHSRK